jgi:hypothetical protein
MARFYLCEFDKLLAVAASLPEGTLVHPDTVDNAMMTLNDAARHAAAYCDSPLTDNHQSVVLMEACEDARACLDQLVKLQASAHASQWCLPTITHDHIVEEASPYITIPPAPAVTTKVLDEASTRTLALENVSHLHHVSPDATVESLELSVCDQNARLEDHIRKRTTDTASCFNIALSLATEVEQKIWALVEKLPSTIEDDLKPVLDFSDIRRLLNIYKQYRKALRLITCNLRLARGILISSIRSKDVLVAWCIYCLIHQNVAHAYPTLRAFAPALDYKDMDLLVLTDSASMSSLTRISTYLHLRRPDGCKPVFSGRPMEVDNMAEFAQATVLSASCIDIRREWDMADRMMTTNRETRWERTERKQALCKEYQLQADLQYEQYDTCNRSHAGRCRTCRGAQYYKVYDYYASRVRGEQTPDPPQLIQPLPSSRDQGLPALFYCLLPEPLKLLGSWSFECYQILTAVGGLKLTAAAPSDRTEVLLIHSHYNVYNGTLQSGLHEAEGLHWFMPKIKDQHHSSMVQNITSPLDGVVYPLTSPISMKWKQGDQYFNPFVMTEEQRAKLRKAFVEELPEVDRTLSWALELNNGKPGSLSLDRGNMGIANKGTRPKWASEQEYLTLASLRAYPLQQIRKLCTALRDRLLPLSHNAVHAFVHQTLCQIGELRAPASSLSVEMTWKYDLFYGDGLIALSEVLDSLVEELRCKPRDEQALLLVGEIAAFLGGLPDGAACISVARKASAIATQWADDLNEDIAAGVSAGSEGDDVVRRCRAKQHLYLSYALIFYGTSVPITEVDAAAMLLLRVRMNQTEYGAEPPSCCGLAQAVISSHVCDLERLLKRKHAHLSAAARAALPLLDHKALAWKSYTSSGMRLCYFDAVTADSNLISVNILNGIVLQNGLPLQTLPLTITTHPLYIRTFGARNFDIVLQKDGFFVTRNAIRGRIYKFFLSSSTNELWVHEEVVGTAGVGNCSRLLDHGAVETWGRKLPPRLRELHSFWYSEDPDIIQLRPLLYENHEVEFLYVLSLDDVCLTSAEDEGLSSRHQLCRIPRESQLVPIDELVTTTLKGNVFPRLLEEPTTEGQKTMLRVLSKFEEVQYIERYATADGNLLVTLPRFHLEFETHPSVSWLQSLDHRMYHLSDQQQLADTMLGFTNI